MSPLEAGSEGLTSGKKKKKKKGDDERDALGRRTLLTDCEIRGEPVVCIHICIHMSMCVSVHVYTMYTHICVYTCIRVGVCMCTTLLSDCEVRGEPAVCIHMYMCINMYMCVCVRVYKVAHCEVRGEPVVYMFKHICVSVCV